MSVYLARASLTESEIIKKAALHWRPSHAVEALENCGGAGK
jgi:hypothetical protein